MSTVALLKTDLSSLRLICEGTADAWEPAGGDQSEPESARELRASAENAAAWTASNPSVRRRLGAIVLDVEDGLCTWVKAPSTARPVLTAALRSTLQEWGEQQTFGSAEPAHDGPGIKSSRSLLERIRPSKKPDPSEEADAEPTTPETSDEELHDPGGGVTIVSLPDALVRLWLDALDRKGVRVTLAMSLWHALARAWTENPSADADTDEITAIILAEPNKRIVWCWSDGAGRLLAGGQIGLDPSRAATNPADDSPQDENEADAREPGDDRADACKRLSLDWLTWSSQLGIAPDKLRVVGADAAEWVERLGSYWNELEAEATEHADPITETLVRLSDLDDYAGEPSGRVALPSLTARPTRATRSRYLLAGAAMTLLLLAVTSVAFRLWDKAGQWRERMITERASAVQLVRGHWTDLQNTRIGAPGRIARQKLQEEISVDPFKPPPDSAPIYEELARVVGILAAQNNDSEIVIMRLQLDQDRNNEFQFEVPDRQKAADLLVELQKPDGFIAWDFRGRNPNPLSPKLSGDWRR